MRPRGKDKELGDRMLKAYLELKDMPQGAEVDQDIQTLLIKSLLSGKEPAKTLLGIIELLRIYAPECVLDDGQLDIFFNLLIETMSKEKINLESFISCRIPSLMSDAATVTRMVSLVKTATGTAKQYLREIIIILIEESEEEVVRKIVRAVLEHLPRDPSYNIVFASTREITAPLVEVMMEEYDDKKYADVYASYELRENLLVRNVKGPSKMKYIKAAMSERNFEKLCSYYLGDRDKKVVTFLAENCTPEHGSIFHRLLTDHDENVRAAVLEKIGFEEVVQYGLQVHGRVLDSSPKVRSIVHALYRSGADFYRRNLMHEFEEEEENARNTTESDHLKCFLEFTRFMFLGILTRCRGEAIETLRTCGFTPEFFYRIRKLRGVEEFLDEAAQTLGYDMASFSALPTHPGRRSFCLRYFFCGRIPREELTRLISEDVDSALVYLEDKALTEYIDALISRALAGSIKEALKIVQLLGPHLRDRPPPEGLLGDQELLLYAHSNLAVGAASDPSYRRPAFANLYFLAHQKASLEVMQGLLKEFNGTSEELIEILLGCNYKSLLGPHVEYFMNASLSHEEHKRLLRSKKYVGAMIYFLNTGSVNISSTGFFVFSIYLISMHATNRDKTREIYERYCREVAQETFDRFYTICSKLKNMSLQSDAHGIREGKVVLSDNDRMLYFICGVIACVREGKLVDEGECDLSMFHVLPDNIADMIRLGHSV
jgi:hypothetical protein